MHFTKIPALLQVLQLYACTADSVLIMQGWMDARVSPELVFAVYTFLLSDPQLTMRGPPGPAGMTGRSGPLVSAV